MTHMDAENFQQIWNRLWGARFTEKQAEQLKREIDLRVEKVEVFKPGDRIRYISEHTPFEITLGDKGFFQHYSTSRVEFYHYSDSAHHDSFTSGDYERVYPA